jgi:hypothetical protein
MNRAQNVAIYAELADGICLKCDDVALSLPQRNARIEVVTYGETMWFGRRAIHHSDRDHLTLVDLNNRPIFEARIVSLIEWGSVIVAPVHSLERCAIRLHDEEIGRG